MASDITYTVTTVATDRNRVPLVKNAPRRRRTSCRSQLPAESVMSTSIDPHTALMQGHDHEHASERSRHLLGDKLEDSEQAQANKSEKIQKMITPYLAEHIPQQYNPTGGANSTPGNTNAEPVNTKFCYRHRPDLLCRRQADEPTMEQLQQDLGKESQADQQSIANVWSLFSAAPARHRNLMLQGILTQCCFPQLSFIASSVRNLIKIDFINALPHELGFKILSFLDTTSLCKAAQVSRKWRQLADDDVVWHKMCEQHIDRKCTKCGWGLPMLDRARLRHEKRRIQLRASGQAIDEWSPSITSVSETEANLSTLVHRHSDHSDCSEITTGTKRSAPSDSLSPEISAKRSCTESTNGEARDQSAPSFDQPKKRPWKDVYKDRFRVGINWKHGRYSTTTLRGHTNGVMSLQFDEQTLITGSYDATVKVWDVNTGEELRTLTGHTAGVRCLQFDDSRLITGSLDRTIKVWNWRTGTLVRTLNGHSDGVIGLHLAGSLLASGSSDHTIMVHDFKNFQRVTLRGHTDWVNSVKIDLASRTLFSASDDMTVKLWDLDTYDVIKTYEGHVGQVQQVLPLPHDFEIDEDDFNATANTDASDAASQSSSDNEDVQSSAAKQKETVFPNDPSRPSPPSYMLTGSLDGTLRLWHVPSGRCVHRFFGHVEGVWSLAADSLRVVSGAEDKTIKIWDPRTGKAERTLACHEGPVTCIGLSDERLVSGSEDGTVRIHSFTRKYDD